MRRQASEERSNSIRSMTNAIRTYVIAFFPLSYTIYWEYLLCSRPAGSENRKNDLPTKLLVSDRQPWETCWGEARRAVAADREDWIIVSAYVEGKIGAVCAYAFDPAFAELTQLAIVAQHVLFWRTNDGRGP